MPRNRMPIRTLSRHVPQVMQFALGELQPQRAVKEFGPKLQAKPAASSYRENGESGEIRK